MQAANDFTVEITDHTTQARFIRGGGTQDVTRVAFFVGKFGPFTEEFPKGQDGPDVIQAAIARKVQALRQLNTATY